MTDDNNLFHGYKNGFTFITVLRDIFVFAALINIVLIIGVFGFSFTWFMLMGSLPLEFLVNTLFVVVLGVIIIVAADKTKW